MHVMIINGSPRVEKYSNTDKIIDAFTDGLTAEGASFEKYAVSGKNRWEEIRDAYVKNTEILIALPLYVENIPGLLLEFLETLPVKDKNTRMSFILQGGFAEASQLECGKKFLEKLTGYLGVSYGGTLIKGDNFGIRFWQQDEVKKITGPYAEMGKAFVKENGFKPETVSKFAGPAYFPLPMRVMIGFVFKTFAKKKFTAAAKEWGCTVPLDDKPWERTREERNQVL